MHLPSRLHDQRYDRVGLLDLADDKSLETSESRLPSHTQGRLSCCKTACRPYR